MEKLRLLEHALRDALHGDVQDIPGVVHQCLMLCSPELLAEALLVNLWPCRRGTCHSMPRQRRNRLDDFFFVCAGNNSVHREATSQVAGKCIDDQTAP